MTLIVVALSCEAKPLIKHFGLKKETGSNCFNIYASPDIRLIISGTGIVKSAAAATYLIFSSCGGSGTQIFNIGICGTALDEIPIGTPMLFNKIVNHETKREFYPDILIKHDFQEATIHSFLSPARRDEIAVNAADGSADNDDNRICFADMEAAGYFEASSIFLPPHSIYCLKAVSDHLDVERLKPQLVSQLIEANINRIESLITAAKSLRQQKQDVLSPYDIKLMEEIAQNLKFSVSMKHQFKNLAIEYKIRNGRELEILEQFRGIIAGSKLEGKGVFGQIKRELGN